MVVLLGEGESVFFKGVALGKGNHAPEDCPHLYVCAVILSLGGFKERKKEKRHRVEGGR